MQSPRHAAKDDPLAVWQSLQRETLLPSFKNEGAALIVVGFAYFALSVLGLKFAVFEGAGSPIWPAAGLAIAGLMLGGIRLWPAIFIGRFMAALATGSDQPLWADLTIALGNAVAAILPVVILRQRLGDLTLGRVSDVIWFLTVGAAGSAFLSASIGTATLAWSLDLTAMEAGRAFGFWAVGNFAGTVILAPLILCTWHHRPISAPLQLTALVGLTSLFCIVVFILQTWPDWLRPWHVVPLLLWAAVVFQVFGTALILVVIASIATTGTALNGWPTLMEPKPSADALFLLQQFLSILGSSFLVLACVRQQQVLREEDRLELALSASNQGSILIRLSDEVVEFDTRAATILGFDTEKQKPRISAQQFLSLVAPGDRDAILTAMRDRTPDVEEIDIPLRLASDTGEALSQWLVLRARREFIGSGPWRQPAKIRGTLRDVTDAKLAEQATRESERFVRRVLDSLSAFVGVLRPDGTLMEANRGPLEAAGLTAQDVIGKKYWDCYWWSHDPHVAAELRRSIARAAAGETVRYDTQVRISDDDIIWIDFQLVPLRGEDGEITHLVPSGSDLTERRASEAERRRLSTIIEATPDFIGIASADGRTTFLNRGAREMLALPGDAPIVGRRIGDWHPDETLLELQTQALPRAAQEGSWEGVTEIKRSDGTRRPISQVIIAHHGEDGEVESFSTIARDISDRIEAEQKQRLLLRELAHRVKNTLTVIQSIARQTLRRTTDPVTFARVFEGRVASLAASHNLLTETDWSGVSLSDVIRSQTTAVASGAVERIVLDGPVVILPSETATRAGLMFHELATNAVKYGALSNDAGQVQISWAAPEDGALAIEWSETGGPEIASAPTARGFGSTLIDMSGGQVQRTFRPEGLWLTVTIPLNEPPKTT